MMFGLISFWLACSFRACANASFAENPLDSVLPWFTCQMLSRAQ